MENVAVPPPCLRDDQPRATTDPGLLHPAALLTRPDASLMVLAPHPDDETLAAGGLIQRALACRARVCVVFASDGENNPWPQRVLEQRVWIGSRQRVAWAARRRAEADASLRILGADGIRVHRLGWPDGGVTREMLADSAPLLARLRELIICERPTLLVQPVLHDRHPDHSALHVLIETTLQRMPRELWPVRLGYLLHGGAHSDAPARITLALTATEQANKRRAIEAHASQLALARARLLRFVAGDELFVAGPESGVHVWPRLPWAPPRQLRPALVLLAADAGGVVRLVSRGSGAPLHWRDGRPAARLPRSLQPPIYVKLVCPLPSPWIFDRWGWCRFRSGGA